MATELIAGPGLYVWELEYAGGEIRHALGTSLDTLINQTTPIVRALRGPAFAGTLPAITSLNPSSGDTNDPAFTLHVLGAGFQPGAVVLWDGQPAATTYVGTGELTAPVASLAGGARSVPVAVQDVAGQTSNALAFTIETPLDEERAPRTGERPAEA